MDLKYIRIFASVEGATYERLSSFSELPDRWHFGEGRRIKPKTISAAAQLLSEVVASWTKPRITTQVFPGLAGEVRVCFYAGNGYFEFTINEALRIEFIREENGVEVEEISNLDLKRAVNKMTILGSQQWPIFASFPSYITTSNAAVFRAVDLVPQAKTEESQWWTRNVSVGQATNSAAISLNFTQDLGATRRSIGDYLSCQRLLA